MDVVAGIEVPALWGMTLCCHLAMKWLQWNPDRKGVAYAFAVLVLVVSLFAFLVIHFPDFQRRWFKAGFGPDWECADRIKGDPVCIGKLDK
jgi:hypothetical protein